MLHVKQTGKLNFTLQKCCLWGSTPTNVIDIRQFLGLLLEVPPSVCRHCHLLHAVTWFCDLSRVFSASNEEQNAQNSPATLRYPSNSAWTRRPGTVSSCLDAETWSMQWNLSWDVTNDGSIFHHSYCERILCVTVFTLAQKFFAYCDVPNIFACMVAYHHCFPADTHTFLHFLHWLQSFWVST